MTVLIEELKEYLLEHGFKDKGTWYFRSSWMNHTLLPVLHESRIVKKLGSLRNAHSMGINLPDDGKYNSRMTGRTFLYQVVDDKINNMMANKSHID